MENTGFIFINLLPYRKKIKQFKIKQFSMLMGTFAFVGLVLVGIVHGYYSARIEMQENRNDFIETENKALDKQISSISNLKNEIKLTLDKRKVVELLQVNRADGVNIINQVANNLPDGTALKSIKQEKSLVTIVGQTTSNNKVSNYMTSLGNTETFKDPNLLEIKSVILVPASTGKSSSYAQEIKANEFTITVKMIQSLDDLAKDVKEYDKQTKIHDVSKK